MAPTMEVSPKIIVERDILYKTGATLNEYERTRCRLDLHIPPAATGCPSLVWFHGGGMNEGDKAAEETPIAARAMASHGIIVAAANYRLSPRVSYPEYLRDAAAAFAWVRSHIGDYGGDPTRCFIGGHSAGGYLAWMLAVAPTHLGEVGLDRAAVAGVVPISGQTVTHTAIRAERGLSIDQIIVDATAPLYHASGEVPPILAICAEDDIALRYQENALLCAALVKAGAKPVTMVTIPDRDHTSIIRRMGEPDDPVSAAVAEFVGA